jgi:hypothetical protein
MRAAWIGLLGGLMVGCGGAESDLASACEDGGQSEEICECFAGKVAEAELSSDALDLVKAQLTGDAKGVAAARETMDWGDGMSASVVVVGAFMECGADFVPGQ